MPADLEVRLRPEETPVTPREIIDQLADEFDDHSNVFRRRCLWWMNRIIDDINGRYDWPWKYQAAVIVTSPSRSEYQLEDDAETVIGPMDVEGFPAHVSRRDPSYVLRMTASDPSRRGMPEAYAVTHLRTVIFFPAPDKTYRIVYRYQTKTRKIETEDDQLLFPAQVVHAITMGLIFRLRMADDRNDPATSEARSAYENIIQNTIWMHEQSTVHIVETDEDEP